MWNYYLGLFLKSIATLTLELSLVRVISVSKWSHYAYLVVSMALLGFGASGTCVSLWSQRRQKIWGRRLYLLNVFMAAAILATFFWSNRIPLDPAQLAWDSWQLFHLVYYYLVLSLPFFLAGMVSSLAFSIHHEKSHYFYFADLLGAALGSLFAVYLLFLLPPNRVIVISSMLCLAAAWSFTHKKGVATMVLLLALLLEASLLYFNPIDFLKIYMSPFKALPQALRFPDSKIIATHWNAHSRVDVFRSPAVHFAPGLSLMYQENLPPQLGLTTDGDYLNAITSGENLETNGRFMNYLPSTMVYAIKPGASVLIINSGGGLNILEAIYEGASSIDAIEPNSAIISLLRGPFRDFSGDIYGYHRINTYNEEARSYLARTDKQYDIIQMSLSTNPSAASTGLYSLNENYLFTVEAFMEYISHLKQDGIFTLSRYLLPPPREDVRFISLVREAMETLHIKEYHRNVFLFRSWGTITLLLKKGPFGPEEIETLKRNVKALRFDLVYYPGIEREEVNRFNRFAEPFYYEITQDLLFQPSGIIKKYPFDLSAVYDDQPFYFHFFKWHKMPELYRLLDERWQAFLEGGYLIVFMLGQAILLAFCIIVAPMLWKQGALLKAVPGKFSYFIYFSSIGLAFMLIELSLIQKFILILEHPTVAFSLVLFALLLSSGFGSYLGGHKWVQRKLFLEKKSSFLPSLLLVLSLGLFLYSFGLSHLFQAISEQSLIIRKIFAFFAISPLGFFMGLPFPSALTMLGRKTPELIPWAWAINGSNSVIGAILASQIALAIGFSGVLRIAALFYAISILAIIKIQQVRAVTF